MLSVGGPLFGATVPFPLFVVPDGILAGLAVIAALLVLPLAVAERGARLVTALVCTAAAFAGNVFFAIVWTDYSGFADPRPAGFVIDGYVTAAALTLVCLGILSARRVRQATVPFRRRT